MKVFNAKAIIVSALVIVTLNASAQTTPDTRIRQYNRLDRMENKFDRKENKFDRRENVADRKEDRLDRHEDVRDRQRRCTRCQT